LHALSSVSSYFRVVVLCGSKRIYGTAWETPEQLRSFKLKQEEAKRRDHRLVGRALQLFSIQEDAGGGLVFWHPKGSVVRRLIEDYWKDEHAAVSSNEFLMVAPLFRLVWYGVRVIHVCLPHLMLCVPGWLRHIVHPSYRKLGLVENFWSL
jgi:hypothetical protein